MYRALRDLGLLWIAICAWLDDRSQHSGKRISAYQWAKDNAPIGKRWLDEHAKFARDEWDDFMVAWKWAQSEPYSPERHPSLSTARDLIDAKKRSDHYHSASDRSANSSSRRAGSARNPSFGRKRSLSTRPRLSCVVTQRT